MPGPGRERKPKSSERVGTRDDNAAMKKVSFNKDSFIAKGEALSANAMKGIHGGANSQSTGDTDNTTWLRGTDSGDPSTSFSTDYIYKR